MVGSTHCMCIYIYIYIYMYVHLYVYIYIYMVHISLSHQSLTVYLRILCLGPRVPKVMADHLCDVASCRTLSRKEPTARTRQDQTGPAGSLFENLEWKRRKYSFNHSSGALIASDSFRCGQSKMISACRNPSLLRTRHRLVMSFEVRVQRKTEEIRFWGHHIQNIERTPELGNVACPENFFYLELLAQFTQVTSLAVVFFYSLIS